MVRMRLGSSQNWTFPIIGVSPQVVRSDEEILIIRWEEDEPCVPLLFVLEFSAWEHHTHTRSVLIKCISCSPFKHCLTTFIIFLSQLQVFFIIFLEPTEFNYSCLHSHGGEATSWSTGNPQGHITKEDGFSLFSVLFPAKNSSGRSWY